MYGKTQLLQNSVKLGNHQKKKAEVNAIFFCLPFLLRSVEIEYENRCQWNKKKCNFFFTKQKNKQKKNVGGSDVAALSEFQSKRKKQRKFKKKLIFFWKFSTPLRKEFRFKSIRNFTTSCSIKKKQ